MTASKERFTREFIEWNEVTGALEPDTGWYYEALSIVEDADKEIERLRGLLHEVANSGISYDASKYLEVQIDADTWKGLAEFRGTVETTSTCNCVGGGHDWNCPKAPL